ncbi:hypothetical protein [Rhodococcus pyridinivorans]|uniref:hypothetical protein n=1 Tax=Rhodococcus pyridinivorans TaxID=103816 RepID=UPI0039B40674
MVVIGSGATAITLILSILKGKGAPSHVTMLHRTPLYIMTMPRVDRLNPDADPTARQTSRIPGDPMEERVDRLGPGQDAHHVPKASRRMIRSFNAKELPAGFDVDTHFDPTVDGHSVNLSSSMLYRGMMLSGVPNQVMAVGYTTSSWTLKIALLGNSVTELLRHMDTHGYDTATTVAPTAPYPTDHRPRCRLRASGAKHMLRRRARHVTTLRNRPLDRSRSSRCAWAIKDVCSTTNRRSQHRLTKQSPLAETALDKAVTRGVRPGHRAPAVAATGHLVRAPPTGKNQRPPAEIRERNHHASCRRRRGDDRSAARRAQSDRSGLDPVRMSRRRS